MGSKFMVVQIGEIFFKLGMSILSVSEPEE